MKKCISTRQHALNACCPAGVIHKKKIFEKENREGEEYYFFDFSIISPSLLSRNPGIIRGAIFPTGS
jgi:hypothetical protein